MTGPRELQLIRLDVEAFREGSAEGGVGGLGVVHVVKLPAPGRRKARFVRVWCLNGERMPAAKIYRLARALDAFEEIAPC